ncbi:hypothetical protein LCGC14_0448810 [marine sediment metagenome]|uniref:Uncharacterized protein n=1 Tax=marine sediment metagenome TaxID=412755 RepID=A0A0F9SIB1_9ZZZZ
MKSVASESDKDKTLSLLRAYLLNMQTQILTFSDKMNTEINGLVFEIDKVIPRKAEQEQ